MTGNAQQDFSNIYSYCYKYLVSNYKFASDKIYFSYILGVMKRKLSTSYQVLYMCLFFCTGYPRNPMYTSSYLTHIVCERTLNQQNLVSIKICRLKHKVDGLMLHGHIF